MVLAMRKKQEYLMGLKSDYDHNFVTVQKGSNIQTQLWNAFASVFITSLAIRKLTIIGDCGGTSFQPARTRE